jgi:hypothetical protein
MSFVAPVCARDKSSLMSIAHHTASDIVSSSQDGKGGEGNKGEGIPNNGVPAALAAECESPARKCRDAGG